MKRTLLILTLWFPFTPTLLAQFQVKYEGGWSEVVEDIDFMEEGTIMSGYSVGSPMSAIALHVKDNQKLIWSNKYFIDNGGNNTIAYFNDIRSFSQGGQNLIAITGGTSWLPGTAGKSDMLFTLLDEAGSPLKSSSIGTSEYDQGLIVKKVNSGFIIIGETHPAPNPNYYWNITAALVDLNGNLIQSAEYFAPGRQKIYDVAETESGYILVGETNVAVNSCDGDSLAAFVMAIDNKLYPTWNKVIDINPVGQFSKDAAVGVAIYKERIWVAGYRSNSTNFQPATVFMQMDLLGNISWLYEYDITLAQAFSQQVLPSGDLENLIMTLKGLMMVDYAGTPIWYKEYPGNLPFLKDLALSENYNGFAMSSTDASNSTLHQDLHLIRTKSKGESDPACEVDINPAVSKPDYCESRIPIDVVGNLYQNEAKVRYTKFPLVAYDCQYNPLTQKTKTQGMIYPNPSSDYILLQDPNIREVTIHNTMGRKIQTYVPKDGRIDIQDLQPGSYILRLRFTEGEETQYRFNKE